MILKGDAPMQPTIENIVAQIAQTGSLILFVHIVAILLICWMFRSAISKAIEHLLYFPGTKNAAEEQVKEKNIPSLPEAEKTTGEQITINVTNVNIHAPANIKIDHNRVEIGPRCAECNDEEKIALNGSRYGNTMRKDNSRKIGIIWGFISLAVLAVAFFSSWRTNDRELLPERPPAQSETTGNTNTGRASTITDENKDAPAVQTSSGEAIASRQNQPVPTSPSKPETEKAIDGVRKELNGRGRSDVGRNEPQYVGIIGYAAISKYYGHDWILADKKKPYDVPWRIKTYQKDKQFWNETEDTLEHKTEIIVKEQMLSHEGYSYYSGYLLVQRRNDKKEFFINVKNFITKPYWTYSDVLSALRVGPLIAVFHQRSDYYPVNKSNKKVDVPDGTLVFIYDETQSYGRDGPDYKTNQACGRFWREDEQKQEWAFFNKDDLQIQY